MVEVISENGPPVVQRRKRIQRLMPNVRYCINTGYLYAPSPGENILFTRFFLLAYGAVSPIPARNFGQYWSLFGDDDHSNPVDPSSIICTCSVCTPANNLFPVTRRTITAYAHEVPPTRIQQTNGQWSDPRPAPSVSWSTRSTPSEIVLRWSRIHQDVADVRYYEIFSYRDLLPSNYRSNPWNRLTIVKHRSLKLRNFQHGGLYHYTVRSVDIYGRYSPFSKVASLFLPVT